MAAGTHRRSDVLALGASKPALRHRESAKAHGTALTFHEREDVRGGEHRIVSLFGSEMSRGTTLHWRLANGDSQTRGGQHLMLCRLETGPVNIVRSTG